MEKLRIKHLERFKLFEKQKSEIRRLWNVDTESAQLLFFLLKAKNANNVLEVGTSNGFSTFIMSLAVNNNCMIETIEVDEKRYQMAIKNLCGLENIKQYFGKAEDIIPSLTNDYDFVFIDANKKAYIDYINLIMPKLNDNAIIVADNICSHCETTKLYQNFIKNDNRFTTMLLNHEAGFMISLFKKVLDF
ncbi:MAG: class I SAM-dependent methyltransferase [Candidatus Cloacimonadales bacterium]|jgi:predicted O-methyltransferase YrrM|nr:class I SAM-dependent methyltransferase [Candidatus Cloacimonadota bacterium]MDD2651196.1 class I SAM-dependent methyltransferase [Candidatus Cloacimonadota bacterium]MDX9977916.1 class I SAM-dependent methyltransferase [Candidatus Cloacimonadales bacterium]